MATKPAKKPAKKATKSKKAAPKKAAAKKPATKTTKAKAVPIGASTAKKTAAAGTKAPKCAVSLKATHAARVLRDSGTPAAGRYLAAVVKPAANACAKANGTYKKPHRRPSKTAGAKANTARMKKIATAARKIYDAKGYKGTWIDATVTATEQLQRAGKM